MRAKWLWCYAARALDCALEPVLRALWFCMPEEERLKELLVDEAQCVETKPWQLRIVVHPTLRVTMWGHGAEVTLMEKMGKIVYVRAEEMVERVRRVRTIVNDLDPRLGRFVHMSYDRILHYPQQTRVVVDADFVIVHAPHGVRYRYNTVKDTFQLADPHVPAPMTREAWLEQVAQ